MFKLKNSVRYHGYVSSTCRNIGWTGIAIPHCIYHVFEQKVITPRIQIFPCEPKRLLHEGTSIPYSSSVEFVCYTATSFAPFTNKNLLKVKKMSWNCWAFQDWRKLESLGGGYSHTWAWYELMTPFFQSDRVPILYHISIGLTPSFCRKNRVVSITFGSRDTWT